MSNFVEISNFYSIIKSCQGGFIVLFFFAVGQTNFSWFDHDFSRVIIDIHHINTADQPWCEVY